MTELETYKRALQKISEYGIKPTGETELQRIKRLKSIADKALFIADVVGRSEQLVCPFCQSDDLFEFELKHSKCRKCNERWTN